MAKEEHDQNLHNIMKVTRPVGLCFNSAKCAVDQKEIHLFGAVFSKNELHLDPYKVDEIKSLLSPNNVAKLQRMVGIITWHLVYLTSQHP